MVFAATASQGVDSNRMGKTAASGSDADDRASRARMVIKGCGGQGNLAADIIWLQV